MEARRAGAAPRSSLAAAHARFLRGLGTAWGAARIADLKRGLADGWLFPVRLAESSTESVWCVADRSSPRGVRVHALQLRESTPRSLEAVLDDSVWSTDRPLFAMTDLVEGVSEKLQTRLLGARGFWHRAMVRIELPDGAAVRRVPSHPGFRHALPSDRDLFVSHYRRVYREPQGDYWLSPSPTVEVDAQRFFDQFLDSPSTWNRKIATNGSIVLVAEGRMIGSVFAGWTRDGAAHVFGLAVDPDRQRAGIGRALLLESLHWLREAGAGPIALSVLRGTPAHRLYGSVGFEEVPPPKGILPGYWIRSDGPVER